MDEPISLRQRLWLDYYLGQDWIRGFASAYFDYDPAIRDWTDEWNIYVRACYHRRGIDPKGRGKRISPA